jgi:hypothetical protein
MPETTAGDTLVVAQMGKSCSFNIGHHDTRTSLTCDRMATSAVFHPDASIARPRFRCEDHQGQWDAETIGEVVKEGPTSLMWALS